MNHDQMIEVIQAHKEGKDVEFKMCNNDKGSWIIAGSPCWDFDTYDYRVKPEPLECWVNEYSEHGYAHASEERAMAAAGSGALRVAVHMREVV